MRHILKNEHDTWNKPDITIDWFFFLFNKWLGDGIFSLQHGTHIHGLLHRFQRKVVCLLHVQRMPDTCLKHDTQIRRLGCSACIAR